MRRERVVKYTNTNTNTNTNLTQPNECEVEKTHKLSNFFEVMEKTAEIKKVTKIVIPARDLFMDKGIKFQAHLFSKIESFRNQRKRIYETKFLVRKFLLPLEILSLFDADEQEVIIFLEKKPSCNKTPKMSLFLIFTCHSHFSIK